MQTINQLAEDQITDILNKYHAFFAFSNKQFEEQVTKGYKYVSCPHGMHAPKQYANKVMTEILAAYSDAAKTVQAETSKKDRIWYEFSNHECQIVGDYSDAVDALSSFDDITIEDIKSEWSAYWDHCVDNDYF